MKWKENINKKYLVISIYVVVVAAVIYAFSKVADHLPGIFNWLMYQLRWLITVLKPIFLGFVFAYLTRPVVKFFEKRISKIKFLKKGAKSISIVLTLLLIIIALVGIISALVFSVTDQIRVANFDDILIAINQMLGSLDEFYKSLMNKLGTINIESNFLSGYMENASSKIFDIIRNAIGGLITSIANISGYFSTIMFSVILGIYFMLDGDIVMLFIGRVSNAVFSEKINKKSREAVSDLHIVFSGYIQGQLCDVAFMVVAISLTLSITGVKFAAMIGIIAGLCNLIPYLGPFAAYGLTILVCTVNGQYKTMFVAIIALFIIQVVDGNIIEPKFLGKSIKIHPLLIIIFLIFGSAIGGVFGMLLAVPIGGFIKIEFMKWLERKEAQKGIEIMPPVKPGKKDSKKEKLQKK